LIKRPIGSQFELKVLYVEDEISIAFPRDATILYLNKENEHSQTPYTQFTKICAVNDLKLLT